VAVNYEDDCLCGVHLPTFWRNMLSWSKNTTFFSEMAVNMYQT